MKIVSLKRKSIPKVAVLATALAVGFMVATVDMRPAQAFPSRAQACTTCHGNVAGGVTTAVPSDPGPDAGAAYTVEITIVATAAGNTGYWIDGPGGSFGGGSTAALTYTVDMVAPATTGPQVYTVWTNKGSQELGQASSATYTIDVGPAAPPTTTPPTTTPPTTTPPTTTPPTTTPPTTTPPTVVPTVVPTTIPPVVAPAVVPVGAPATGAGGAAQSNGSPLMGFGGLALLLSGAAMVTAIRRRRQV